MIARETESWARRQGGKGDEMLDDTRQLPE